MCEDRNTVIRKKLHVKCCEDTENAKSNKPNVGVPDVHEMKITIIWKKKND